MSVNKTRNKAYGLSNPLQSLSPEPIRSLRNPTDKDKAEFGTMWINTALNAYFVITSAGVWTAQSAGSTSAASFNVTGTTGDVFTVATGGNSVLGGNLSVAGNSVLAGNLIVNGNLIANGDFDLISSDAISFSSTANADPSLSFSANGGTLETILIEAVQGTSANSIGLSSTVGGILINATSSTSASAISLVSQSGGFNIDSVLASSIDVTGAGQDLNISTTGGSIKLTATESTAGAIALNASGVAGTMTLAGAGGVAISSTNTAISMLSGTGAVNIASDATVNSVNVASGAASKTVTIGNLNTTTSVSILAGTGDLTLQSTDLLVLDAAGIISIDSTGAAISIGVGANAFPINLGTGASSRTISIGNVTGTTSLALNSGTGGIALNSNDTGNISIVAQSVTAAAFAATNNTKVGRVTLTGQTLAQNASQVLTITNSNITLTNAVMFQVSNTNVSAGGALLGIEGITQAAGSAAITVKNNGGAGGLGATDTIIISFMVLG